MSWACPPNSPRYIARKGSVCLDGVSLTVNEVDGERFGVNIVPHTFEETTIGQWRPGSRVNIEVDLIARYLERLLSAAAPTGSHRPCSRNMVLQKVTDLQQEIQLNSIEEPLEDIRAGKMVVLIDDEDRENEGDLVHGRDECVPPRRRQLHGDATGAA